MSQNIPVNVVTGFLESGKTKLINSILKKRTRKTKNILIIQTEQGEQKLDLSEHYCDRIQVMNLPVRNLQNDEGIKECSLKIHTYLKSNKTDEIWVEWNGVLPIASLLTLLDIEEESSPIPVKLCSINKVISIINADTAVTSINATGGAVIDQLMNCDLAVIRNIKTKEQFSRLKRMLRDINSGVTVTDRRAIGKINGYIDREKINPVASLIMWLAIFLFMFALIKAIFGQANTDYVLNVFLGILLQAFPFLLIGILLSSAIQVFVSQKFIESHFPKNRLVGMIFAALSGFCLPVCDCASVPVFRSLVRKGVPVSSAVTFMMATPVINPVVILSTWYAFGGNGRIVLTRIILGIICSIIIGLFFSGSKKENIERAESFTSTVCSCGCRLDPSAISSSGFAAKIRLFIAHAQAEFFSVGKFLIIGALVSSVFQALSKNIPWLTQSHGLLLSIFTLMAMAFLLSLCSSSDAVVAKSFANTFPMGALMGFLVFGPMMDIKNLIMLSGSFTKKFVLKLCIVSALVCSMTVFIVFSAGLGGLIQ